MNPLFFGKSGQALFGVYHPPRTRDVRSTGIVLCYPIGQEYMRAHRAFRQLAILLSKAGFPVLRFDYYGTGDSNGESDAGSLDRWRQDIELAIDELKDNAAVEKVTLVGLRIGATLVAAVQANRADVETALLWDPVVDGPTYFEELLTIAGADETLRRQAESPADIVGIYGFPWSPRLRAEVRAISLRDYPPSAAGRLLIMVSRESAEFEALRRHYENAPNMEFRCIPSPGEWAEVDAYGSALLPQDIIQGIVQALTRAPTTV